MSRPTQPGKRPLVQLFVALTMCMICLQAFAAVSPPRNVPVNVTVEPIVEIILPNSTGSEGITMTTVTNEFFRAGLLNKVKTTQGSIGIGLITNYKGTLRCLDTVLLECGSRSYTVPVGIVLQGVSQAYSAGDYTCLDFEPGSHTGSNGATLTASLSKVWLGYEDAPGTYTGSVILEYIPRQ